VAKKIKSSLLRKIRERLQEIRGPKCYVCGRPLTGTIIYIGQGLYRHKDCDPTERRKRKRKEEVNK